jgi:ABC-type multidrug transport system fused ATPase/permease subunit
MAYLLRSLIVIMILSVLLTALLALKIIHLRFGHIQVAIPTFIYTIFAQAFVMFYFIGVARLANNVYSIITSGTNLNELFDTPPEDLSPYVEKTKKFVEEADRCKRQTIPWTILMLILGMIAFLLGGAHDTGLVQKTTHSGVVLGFFIAMMIGFFRQWYYLGKSHSLLRKLKTLYGIADAQM